MLLYSHEYTPSSSLVEFVSVRFSPPVSFEFIAFSFRLQSTGVSDLKPKEIIPNEVVSKLGSEEVQQASVNVAAFKLRSD